jgi:hypothetical protein
MRPAAVGAVLAALALGCGRGADPGSPVVTAEWVRPTAAGAEPVWGVTGGIAVGLWPTSGPRGLFRIYAPYLGQQFPRMVNYVSVEPVVKGNRGQSELEVGLRGGKPGLAMWSGDSAAAAADFRDPGGPAPGRVEVIDGVEMLTVFVAVEPFRNGARPVIQIIFRADRPHEVGFRVHAAPGGTPMDSCVLSATMGNYARLRRLWLRDEVVDSRRLWPDPTFDRLRFTPWRAWDRDRLFRKGGQVLVAATPNEADPTQAEYDPMIPPHWRYEGKVATQYWGAADVPGLVARVNGRATFWGESGPIPGGLSFENFELEAPFADGQEFWFGVTERTPTELGFDAVPVDPRP